MRQYGFFTFVGLIATIAAPLNAQPVSLIAAQGAFVERSQALIPALQRSSPQAGAPHSLLQPASLPAEPASSGEVRVSSNGSLFAGTQGTSIFAPSPQRTRDPLVSITGMAPFMRQGSSEAEWIRHLIAQAEAGPAGYDAVQYGAKRRPARAPTQMTLGEIYAWIDATPGQPHAIGRYQFIPTTLRRLAKRLGAEPHMRFNPKMQDALADLLLEEAGLSRLMAGELPRQSFMNNLAKIWAGLPTSSGKSHYHGYAGNKATMTWAKFDREMARIFPG